MVLRGFLWSAYRDSPGIGLILGGRRSGEMCPLKLPIQPEVEWYYPRPMPEAGWAASALGGFETVAEFGAPVCGCALGLAVGELGVTTGGIDRIGGWSPGQLGPRWHGSSGSAEPGSRPRQESPRQSALPASCRARDNLWRCWGGGTPWEGSGGGSVVAGGGCRLRGHHRGQIAGGRWNPREWKPSRPQPPAGAGVGGRGAIGVAIKPVAEAWTPQVAS